MVIKKTFNCNIIHCYIISVFKYNTLLRISFVPFYKISLKFSLSTYIYLFYIFIVFNTMLILLGYQVSSDNFFQKKKKKVSSNKYTISKSDVSINQ